MRELTPIGLRNYILDLDIPEEFTVDDIVNKMRKHSISFWYRDVKVREVLKKMEKDGLVTTKIGSTKKADGSITETYYSRV